jgi:hypothetical protein
VYLASTRGYQVMRDPRQNAILEVYQLVLAVFLFVSPWLFAFVHGTLRVDTWVSTALVAVMSFGALIAFRDWKEWINCIPRLVDCGVTVGIWLSTAAMLVNLAIGILIAYLAMLELWLIHNGSSSEKTI